jgi:hypothetical protein
MKKMSILIAIAGGLFFGACNKNKPEKTSEGLPGDNLDLYAVMDIFKSSKNLESFEKSLNDKSNKINNLDLNSDGKVDYIKVIDNKDGDDHAITLRIPVSKNESQDVAVIEVEKNGDNKANVQIIGDEELYGKDFVIEPKNPNGEAGFVFTTVAVNVWYWPCVTYIYSPGYVVYVSPWEYDYYPVWYDPWEPVAYDVYYPVVYQYHSYYYPVGHPRFERAHEIYIDHRVSSGYVREHRENYGPRNGGPHDGQRGMPPQNHNVGPRGNENNYSPRGNTGGRTPAPGRVPQTGPRPHDNSRQNMNGGNSQRSAQPNVERNQSPQNRMQNHRDASPGNNQRQQTPSSGNRMQNHQAPRPENNMPHQQAPMPHQSPSPMPHQQAPMPHQSPSPMPHQAPMPRPQGGRPR